mmetsp:Transcript_2849/g.9603  ORF Transcript_2849/g.9603 Transcript_2849/m.9603 type:complete len:324 (+) Transcript_2849:1360-2331(+)
MTRSQSRERTLVTALRSTTNVSRSIESCPTGTGSCAAGPPAAAQASRTEASVGTSQTCLEKVTLTSHPMSGLPMTESCCGRMESTSRAGQKACRAQELQGVNLFGSLTMQRFAASSQRQSPVETAQVQAVSSAAQSSLRLGAQPARTGQKAQSTGPPLRHSPLAPTEGNQPHPGMAAQTQGLGAKRHVRPGDCQAPAARLAQSISGIISPSHCLFCGRRGSYGSGGARGKTLGRTTASSLQVMLSTLMRQVPVSRSRVGLCRAISQDRIFRKGDSGMGLKGGDSGPAVISLILSMQGMPPSRAASMRKSILMPTIRLFSVSMS